MMNINEAYYVMSHVYHHYLGEVVDVTPRLVTLKNVVRVHSCKRGWEDLFIQGLLDDTTCQRFPDGTTVPYDLGYFPWKHATLPAKKSQ